ncbi:hypothetical protein MUK42_37138 [Musa troglodytarum]|uniref:Uncharacterized protein n=1 Tax=Musa troglodytarum TaxID=320322 RepID=A0A9E7KBE4_9LILI|nr:hypothetical protein MUK42_37138 [Musa troglodytarum]
MRPEDSRSSLQACRGRRRLLTSTGSACPWSSSLPSWDTRGRIAVPGRKLGMHIEVNLKGHQTATKAPEIIMSVRIIAYSQLLQVCQAEYFRQLLKPVT